MRAREPDESGYVVNDGVRIYYEAFGDGEPTILLLPAWSIVHSRIWKAQVPDLARRWRVVTFDGRGNGRSDRPNTVTAYAAPEYVADALRVLEAVGAQRVVVVGLSLGADFALRLAAEHPELVAGAVFVGAAVGLGNPRPERTVYDFTTAYDTDDGWAKDNAHFWRRDWPAFARFFMEQLFSEPHSTKQIDDGVTWALQTDPETMILTRMARGGCSPAARVSGQEPYAAGLASRVRCPCLVIHGSNDQIADISGSERLAAALACRFVVFEGSGHAPNARDPVRFNLLLREFVESLTPQAPGRVVWRRPRDRKRRALWVCSPIGLGHVLRDLAIVRSLRELVPDLEVHWWTQQPVAHVVERVGEIVHPASHELASESAHWESEAGGHDLHAFHAFRRMDEIFCANYLLFDDVVRDSTYDLWVGDESWEIDYFLHENPERKIAPYAFLTDVVGFLPVDPDGDPREVELCADYNAEMIEQRARMPHVRDISLYIGAYDELPDASFGSGLPGIREWTAQWFDSVPYVVPFDPRAYRDPDAVRVRLGYGTGYPLLFAAVGGTAVGRDLLCLVAEGFDQLRRSLPDARMVMVTGPRIDPQELPDVEGLDKRGFVPDLYEHLACADASVVQGGLSTTMELVALGRPFVYFPLRRHWEQQHHVAGRLGHYGAGIRRDFASTTPVDLAAAMREAMRCEPRYRPIPRGGARRAAERIARLLVR